MYLITPSFAMLEKTFIFNPEPVDLNFGVLALSAKKQPFNSLCMHAGIMTKMDNSSFSLSGLCPNLRDMLSLETSLLFFDPFDKLF
jgi:hypothetical protein